MKCELCRKEDVWPDCRLCEVCGEAMVRLSLIRERTRAQELYEQKGPRKRPSREWLPSAIRRTPGDPKDVEDGETEGVRRHPGSQHRVRHQSAYLHRFPILFDSCRRAPRLSWQELFEQRLELRSQMQFCTFLLEQCMRI